VLKANKLGQIKIQQTIFVIVAITILFVIVGLFFLSIGFSNLKKTATSIAEESDMLLVSKLANSPEFSCGKSFGSFKSDCIDFDKVIGLSENKESYSDFWGVAKIEIRKIYPNGSRICTKANYPDCEILKILDEEVNALAYSSNFVSLCRKESDGKILYDKCELALLMVASEDKTQ
jgi:hypothetical protein